MMDAASPPPSPLRPMVRHELAEVRSKWAGLLVVGLVLIALGTLLMVAPWVGTLAAVWVIGTLLILGGVAEFVAAFCVRRWAGFLLALLAGVLYVAVGVLIVDRPVAAAEALTLLIAAFLIVGGVVRAAAAASLRFEGWAWAAASGAVSTLLGLLIGRQWPGASLRVIGLFVGIEVLLTGWTWVMLAMLLRRPPKGA